MTDLGRFFRGNDACVYGRLELHEFAGDLGAELGRGESLDDVGQPLQVLGAQVGLQQLDQLGGAEVVSGPSLPVRHV